MNHLHFNANPTNLPLNYLGYSLLIILAVAAALVKVYLLWRKGRFTQGYRMILGLLGLFLVRLITFLITYLGWQTYRQFTPGLTALDQISSLIGIILILWLWNFPERSRGVDIAVILLGLMTAAMAVGLLTRFSSLLQGLLGSISFWQDLSIVWLVVGIGLILIRKPNLWSYGLFMHIILMLGSFLAVLSTQLEALHLAQLVAYPLLLALGDRFPIGEPRQIGLPQTDQQGRKHFSVEKKILSVIQQLFDNNDPAGILYKIAQTAAYLILADLTMVIDTPDKHGKIRIIAGYDLIREEPLQALTLESKSIPLISNYIERGKMLHIPASSTSRDLSHLAKMLQLSRPGHLLVSPVYVAGANKTIGVILFSPFSNRPWTKEDQNYIRLLCKLFESAFKYRLISQNGDSEGVKSSIRDLSAKLSELTQEKQKLREDIAVLSREHQNLLQDQNALQKKYDNLMNWGNSLQRHLAMLVDLSKKESTEALRKYIAVVEKEIEQVQDEVAYQGSEGKSTPEQEQKAKSPDIDPDSGRPANLKEAILSCLESMQTEIEVKNLLTTLDLPEDPPLLKMNHALFREIFSFLLANAVMENDPESEIRIRTQIYAEDHTQRFAHIKISDQGEGYYPDEITGILNDHLTSEQQEQLSQVMTNLYVTKNLVENEGGRMWVESKPGSGTTVSLLLAFL